MPSKAVKVYDNIFHGFGSEDKRQKENNITKALINVFEHSHIHLRRNFLIDELKLEGSDVQEPINFDLQVKKPLEQKFNKAFILGISDSNSPDSNIPQRVSGKKHGVPDAAIFSNDVCILIEVKVHGRYIFLNVNKEECFPH